MVESTSQKDKSKNEVGEVETVAFGKIKQKASTFLNQKKSWDDEDDFPISPDLKRGLIEELGFAKPSHI